MPQNASQCQPNDIHQGRPIDAGSIRADAAELLGSSAKVDHTELFAEIQDRLLPVNFRILGDLDADEKITQRHYRIITVQEVLRVAQELSLGLGRHQDFVYAFNGEYWKLLDQADLENFLGDAAMRLGVNRFIGFDFEFKGKLYKQFLAQAYLPSAAARNDTVLINLKNGTYEITGNEVSFRPFDRHDFLTYQLPFDYQPDARAPCWAAFLNEVLPDLSRQQVLAEYIGYLFARHLKLEKTLILYGSGANGKSVVFDVMNAVLGSVNVSNYSLESLGHAYYRAMIANKLLNYSSEMSDRIQAEKFKQLTSGEPIEARLPYGQPMILTNYARLAFNCNELPKDIEHSEAFFRRFLIIPFDVFVPEERRDVELAAKIIAEELPGVFNWIIDGLQRLMSKKRFSPCDAATAALDVFRKESDSVAMFLEEESFNASTVDSILLKDIYQEYRTFCASDGYMPFKKRNFAKRLKALGVIVEAGTGNKVYAWLRRS